jgi:hypothetical protein
MLRTVPDDGQKNSPKHVEFHFKNKFEKLVHLVGLIIINLSGVLSYTYILKSLQKEEPHTEMLSELKS